MVNYKIIFENQQSLRKTGKYQDDMVFETPNTKKLAIDIVKGMQKRGYRGQVILVKSLAGSFKPVKKIILNVNNNGVFER